MFDILLKAVYYFFAGWFLWRVLGILYGYQRYRFYKAQGVVFMDNKFTILGDNIRLANSLDKHKNALSWTRMF
jgi:hypothetical protein